MDYKPFPLSKKYYSSNILKCINIPANLSLFGEIHRFEIKIGHSRESCRSEEFLFWGRGGQLARCR